MKKRIALLVACVSMSLLSLTGCGAGEQLDYASSDKAAVYQEMTDTLMQETFKLSESQIDEKISYYTELKDDTYVSLYQAWDNEKSALGDYNGIKDVKVYESTDSGKYAKSYICAITYDFAKRDLDAKVIYGVEENGEVSVDVTSIALSGQYSLKEKMGKAGLNTLMGMGTVFVVLILITFIISLFGIIGNAINKSAEKKAAKNKPAVTPAPAPAPVAAVEEDLSDDLELVAVITAAIAAYEEANGGESSDGLVVRSIRRVNQNKWRNA